MTATHTKSASSLKEAYGCPSAIARSRSIGVRHLCPCCSNVLLRHAQANQVYWRCSHCYQVMPLIGDSEMFMA